MLSAAEHIHADICTVQTLLHKRLSSQQRHAQRQQLHRGPALGLCPGDGHLGQQGQAQGNLQTTASIYADHRKMRQGVMQHSHMREHGHRGVSRVSSACVSRMDMRVIRGMKI